MPPSENDGGGAERGGAYAEGVEPTMAEEIIIATHHVRSPKFQRPPEDAKPFDDWPRPAVFVLTLVT